MSFCLFLFLLSLGSWSMVSTVVLSEDTTKLTLSVPHLDHDPVLLTHIQDFEDNKYSW